MSEYTPTTEEIRERWMNFDGGPEATDAAEFDRWLNDQLARSFSRAYSLGYRDGCRDENGVRVEAYKERLMEAATDSAQDVLDRIAAGSDHGARDIVEAVLAHALAVHDG